MGDFLLEFFDYIPLLGGDVDHDIEFINDILDLALELSLLVDIQQRDDKITQVCREIAWLGEASKFTSPFPKVIKADGLFVVLKRCQWIRTSAVDGGGGGGWTYYFADRLRENVHDLRLAVLK